MFIIPFCIYFVWVCLYYIKVFVISKNKTIYGNYDTLYNYFSKESKN